MALDTAMLSVAYKPIMLNVIMLKAVVPSVAAPQWRRNQSFMKWIADARSRSPGGIRENAGKYEPQQSKFNSDAANVLKWR